MTNPALTWISDAYQGGYLRAAFIDCQKVEYSNLADFPNNTPKAAAYAKLIFNNNARLANGLRTNGVPLSHFLYDETKPERLDPFQYKNKDSDKIPLDMMDFYGVIPTPNEWVYPKETHDGFESDHAEAILDTGDALKRSVLIGSGLTARCCLMDTIIGSFDHAMNPDNHRAVVALDGTNLDGTYHQTYIVDFLARAGKNIRDKIGFAYIDQIIAATQPRSTP